MKNICSGNSFVADATRNLFDVFRALKDTAKINLSLRDIENINL